eukprot:108413-Lingulodinium_polyedra.AAC.1
MSLCRPAARSFGLVNCWNALRVLRVAENVLPSPTKLPFEHHRTASQLMESWTQPLRRTSCRRSR